MRQLYLLFFFVLFVCSLYAQDRAALTGTVTDATGAVITDAVVALQSPDTGLYRTTQSNGDGIYEISSLPVGTYVLTIKKTGFKSFETRAALSERQQPALERAGRLAVVRSRHRQLRASD